MANPLQWFELDAVGLLMDQETVSLSLTERGLLVFLMARQWVSGYVPDDPDKIASLISAKPSDVRRAWPAVRTLLQECGDGRLVHPDLHRQREEALEYSLAQAQRGRLGGRPKTRRIEKAIADAKPSALANAKANAKAQPNQPEEPHLPAPGAEGERTVEQTLKARANVILDLFWARVEHLLEGAFTRTQWLKLNRDAALAFARFGLDDDELLAAYESCARVRGEEPFMLHRLQSYLAAENARLVPYLPSDTDDDYESDRGHHDPAQQVGADSGAPPEPVLIFGSPRS